MNEYRFEDCHECRQDPERMKIAMESDGKMRTVVQELVCKSCGKRLPWWWYSKLPLTDEEKVAVIDRGGKAW